MKLVLPEGMALGKFNRLLQSLREIVGKQWVLDTEQDRDAYLDHYAFDPSGHVSSAAVSPKTAEQVQAIVRVANEFKVPLWPISRGKNLGYGAAAPVLSGSIILDMSRMKKIEMDVENGTVLLEPGVGFYDLYDYIEKNNVPYWVSAPGNAWGSVVGNALDRGVGYTPYGDHAARICGLEVVLPKGDLVRTGMGAMSGSETWNLHPHGFGPNWDAMFVQSNFGIVTKMGMWLMPEPESIVALDMQLDKADDLGWAIDTLAPMRREGLIQQSPSIGNWLRAAAIFTNRDDWYDKPGALPDSVIEAIRKEFGLGWWTINLRFYGNAELTQATAKIVKDKFAQRTKYEMKESLWQTGEPREQEPRAGVPITFPLQNSSWHKGRGGHVSFSPVLPQSGDKALAQFKRTYARYNEFGMDYHASFSLGERHITNINQVLFDKDNVEMVSQVDKFFKALVNDANNERYSEYRAHISYMDLIASTYDFNDNALLRLNEEVKNALDPNGIIAPGKSGIWPKVYEGERS